MSSLEHIGIAVDDVDAVVESFQRLLGLQPYKAETVASQQVRTHFLDAGPAKVELLESIDPDSPIGQYLDDRGEGLHHVAFEVEDLTATMDRLQAAGFRLLSDAPQSGADDKQIVFVHPKETHGVLVEFCESTRPGWTPLRVPHRNGPLTVYERGVPQAPSLLFLHGAAGSTLLEMAPLMRHLESSFHLVGLDLSGHGASAFPADGTLTMDRFVEDVAAAVDALDLSACSLFGFSLGSAVALQFARRHPTSVNRLGLFAPNVDWDEARASALQARLDPDALLDRAPGLMDRLREQHDQPERLLSALRAFVETLPELSAALEDHLSEIAAPSLVMGLDEDPLFPLEATRTVYRRLPNARLSILPGSRHRLDEAPPSLLAPLLRSHFRTA